MKIVVLIIIDAEFQRQKQEFKLSTKIYKAIKAEETNTIKASILGSAFTRIDMILIIK